MAKVKKVRGRIDDRTRNTQLFGSANQIYKQGLDLESSVTWKLSFFGEPFGDYFEAWGFTNHIVNILHCASLGAHQTMVNVLYSG